MLKINDAVAFLLKNGWEKVEDCDEFQCFSKENNIGIDVSDEEIVLIGDDGDFAHIPINAYSLYALLGFLIQHHYIAIDYIWI